MKRSTKFWLVMLIILFIILTIMTKGIIALALLITIPILYLTVCFASLDLDEEDKFNKYNIVLKINNLIDGKKISNN